MSSRWRDKLNKHDSSTRSEGSVSKASRQPVDVEAVTDFVNDPAMFSQAVSVLDFSSVFEDPLMAFSKRDCCKRRSSTNIGNGGLPYFR